MDDAFSLIAAQMPRSRRISPFGIRLTAMLAVAILLFVAFASFVISQERAADARRSIKAAEQEAARQADAEAAALEAAGPATPGPSRQAVNGLLDTRAHDAAVAALDAARQIAAGTSFDLATPAALSTVNHDLVFVEGPSTAPSIVSVFAGGAGWSAAVHGARDTCYWVALTAGGNARYGTGSPCTGMAALAADRPGW